MPCDWLIAKEDFHSISTFGIPRHPEGNKADIRWLIGLQRNRQKAGCRRKRRNSEKLAPVKI
jgi:hypothetical protein